MSFYHVTDGHFGVMADENNGTQGLFKADLLAGTIEFQYMVDENHTVAE